MKAESTFSLKDQLFNAEKVGYLATLFSKAYPAFPKAAFHTDVITAFPALELKERISHITTCLRKHLPDSYLLALNIILNALPPALDPTKTDDDFGDFILSPLGLFVATYGCSAKHLDISLPAIKELTKRFSAEYAIRFFINAFPDETFSFLQDCAADDNYHVRRLASEGSRPKLPWAQKLTTHYTKPLPLLEVLYTDSTRYVTRSVANHLNDISKLEPVLVIDTLARWKKNPAQSPEELIFITTHALRSLVKQGHPGAMKLLGFSVEPDVTITNFTALTPRVEIGKTFEFSFTLRSNKKQKLVVDYTMRFAGNGKVGGQKVFKLKQLQLERDEIITLNKKHPMRLMTTRRLFPGMHQITLQVNGKILDSLSFELFQG